MTTTHTKSHKPETENPLTPPTPIPTNPFIPPGALTLLIGDPGIGKSLLALDIAARLSRAKPPFPSLTPSTVNTPAIPPMTSIISSAEDSESTIISRFEAALGGGGAGGGAGGGGGCGGGCGGGHGGGHGGGALDHAFILKPEVSLSPKSKYPLVTVLTLLLAKLRKEGKNPTLLILDPLPHFLGTYDCSHAASVRRVLTPLLRLANEHQLAILGITHLNKSTKLKSALHRSISSIAYVALARSVLLLTPNDLDPTRNQNQKLLIPIKSNLSRPTHALAFTITDTPPGTATVTERPSPNPTEGTTIAQATHDAPNDQLPLTNYQSPHIEYAPTLITNHPLLTGQPLTRTDPLAKSQLELAETFLRTTLANGPIPSADLLRQARTLALSQRTLHRARQTLNISCYFDITTTQWLCALPTQVPTIGS